MFYIRVNGSVIGMPYETYGDAMTAIRELIREKRYIAATYDVVEM